MNPEDEKTVERLRSVEVALAVDRPYASRTAAIAASAISRLSAEVQELRAALIASAELPSNAITCPDCQGAGRHADESQCSTCAGEGSVLDRPEARGPHIYIDCEFNGWMGDLLSFAMVAEDGREFYSVLPEPSTWDKWCFENVFPVLNKPPVASFADFRLAFIEFLRGYRNPIIVADWPADLYYFNKVLLGNGHEDSILIPCRMELVGCDYESAIPHNALEDARAIMRSIAEDE